MGAFFAIKTPVPYHTGFVFRGGWLGREFTVFDKKEDFERVMADQTRPGSFLLYQVWPANFEMGELPEPGRDCYAVVELNRRGSARQTVIGLVVF